MKKIITTLFAILFCISVEALPVGNPSEASLLSHGAFFNPLCCESDVFDEQCEQWYTSFSLRFGYYGDFIFDRKMKLAHLTPSKHANFCEIHTNAGYIAVNFCNRIDLFTTLGTTYINLDVNNSVIGALNFPNLETPVITKADFSWSVGARATLFEWCGLACGIEGQYFQFSPKNVKYINPAGAQINSDDLPYHFRYREWQVGLGLSYQLTSFLVPYVAVKASRAKINVRPITIVFGGEPLTLSNFRSSETWSGAAGVSLTICETVALTIEGRFIGENALYANAQFRF